MSKSHHHLPTYTGNSAFSNITRSSSNKSSMTIFDLVESRCLSSLYGMLAVALHNLSIVEDVLKNDDGSDWDEGEKMAKGPTHLSITLPCKLFKDSLSRYDISVSNALLRRLWGTVHHQGQRCINVQNAISLSDAHANVTFLTFYQNRLYSWMICPRDASSEYCLHRRRKIILHASSRINRGV